jgi:hypothetical protein
MPMAAWSTILVAVRRQARSPLRYPAAPTLSALLGKGSYRLQRPYVRVRLVFGSACRCSHRQRSPMLAQGYRLLDGSSAQSPGLRQIGVQDVQRFLETDRRGWRHCSCYEFVSRVEVSHGALDLGAICHSVGILGL